MIDDLMPGYTNGDMVDDTDDEIIIDRGVIVDPMAMLATRIRMSEYM